MLSGPSTKCLHINCQCRMFQCPPFALMTRVAFREASMLGNSPLVQSVLPETCTVSMQHRCYGGHVSTQISHSRPSCQACPQLPRQEAASPEQAQWQPQAGGSMAASFVDRRCSHTARQPAACRSAAVHDCVDRRRNFHTWLRRPGLESSRATSALNPMGDTCRHCLGLAAPSPSKLSAIMKLSEVEKLDADGICEVWRGCGFYYASRVATLMLSDS